MMIAALLAASVAVAAPAPKCVPQKAPRTATMTLPGGAKLKVDVVDTPKSRETGLMCVTKMPRDYGMLFVFPMEMDLGFWMKNTLVSLDLVWIGADKRITAIAPRLPASTLDTPEEKVARADGRGAFVLELAAGEAKRRGLKVGDRLSFSTPIPSR
jgi:uncharacterized protein